MAKSKVKGTQYVEEDEKYNTKRVKKDDKNARKSSGIATNLDRGEDEKGFSKLLPSVKGQSKKLKVVLKKGKVV